MQIKLGITGGIGSGKTVVCHVLEQMRVPVYYADIEAKKVMTSDKVLKVQIQESFGEEAYFEDGELNREYLAEQVFSNKESLILLNSFVHPAVKRSFHDWCVKNNEFDILAKEAALLFESGSYKELDKTVLVLSPMELRIKRIMLRDSHRTEEGVKAIINNQLSDEEKLKLTDTVIYNNEKELLIPQLITLLEGIKKTSIF